MHALVLVRVYLPVFEQVFVFVSELVLGPAYEFVETATLSFFVPPPVSVPAVVVVCFLPEDVFVALSVGISVSVDIGACMWWDLYIDAAVAATVATVAVVFEVALVIVVAPVSAIVGEFDLESEIVTALVVVSVFGAVIVDLAGDDDVRFRRHFGVVDDAADEQMIDVNQTADRNGLVPTRAVAVVDRQDED